jgi:ubiquinone/menaquinone biosynthesis C-methylase UbiE
MYPRAFCRDSLQLLPGGVHPLPDLSIQAIIALINHKVGDICWEIGAGTCRLAFCLSKVVGNTGAVLATDFGK